MASAKNYFIALRPFSYTASVIPTVMGVMIAAALHAGDAAFHFSWLNLLLTILGCVTVHAACNLVSEYYDFRKGLDRADNSGARNVIVQGQLTPGEVLGEAAATMLIALAIGAYFIVTVGPGLWWFVAFGFVSALLYSVPPFGLKYHALGDFQVVLSFGSIMTLGAYYVQAHEVMTLSLSSPLLWKVVLYALPSGMLIDAILHANNHRDMASDRAIGIRTLAMLLGERGSQNFEYVLILGAYVLTVAMVAAGYLTPFALITLLTLPKAKIVLTKIRKRGKIDAAAFNIMDVDAAQLHTAYGAAMIVALIASRIVGV